MLRPVQYPIKEEVEVMITMYTANRSAEERRREVEVSWLEESYVCRHDVEAPTQELITLYCVCCEVDGT